MLPGRKGLRQRPQRRDVVAPGPPEAEACLGGDVEDSEIGVHRLPGEQKEPDADVVDRAPGGDDGRGRKPKRRSRGLGCRLPHEPADILRQPPSHWYATPLKSFPPSLPKLPAHPHLIRPLTPK